jgi:hypothetical protein
MLWWRRKKPSAGAAPYRVSPDVSSAFDHLRGPRLDVRCTGCKDPLEYQGFLHEANMKRGALFSASPRTLQTTEFWNGNICTNCQSVWCPKCRSPKGEIGPTPCPKCGTKTDLAFRDRLEKIGIRCLSENWSSDHRQEHASESTLSQTLFQQTLLQHISRIANKTSDFDRFFHQYVGSHTQAKLSKLACENLALTASDHEEHNEGFSEAPVYFVISSLPTSLAGARDWIARHYGGYTHYAAKLWGSRPSGCSTWCHLICGTSSGGHWVQLSLSSFESPRLLEGMLMPVDLLTLEERKALGL